jgi:CBS domain-containing protein
MLVREVMAQNVQYVSPSATLQECARRMRDLHIGSLPVWENGKLAGMITDRDICCRAVAEGRDPAKTKAHDIMTKDVTFCFDDQECDDAAHMMEEKHIRRLAVLNRKRSMVGFLSIDDLARCSHELAGEVLEAAKPLH